MKGFTLVEMLVALLIFGLIAAASVAVMGTTLTNQTAVRASVDRYAQLQQARAVLKADLAQAALRRTRGLDGLPAPVAFTGGDPWGGGGPLMSLTRHGWENPDRQARASMQYAEYRLVEARLERRSRPALDGAPLGPPQVLITGVRQARASFFAQGRWRTAWKGAPGEDIPQAVRLDLDIEGIGPVSQLFLASGDGA